MAQKVQVVLVDDVDGGEAVETVTFGLDGVSYEIDLSEDNASEFREAIAAWVGHARRVGGRSTSSRRRSTGTKPARAESDTASVREWARQSGYQVSDRGRISAEVREAYDAAH